MTVPVRFYAIAPTLLRQDGHPDTSAIAENLNRLASHGVEGVLLTGSYGEFQVLDDAERVAVTQGVVEGCRVRSVMSGAAALHTRSAATVARALAEAGADQVMVSAPFAAELTDDDLLRHFHDIGDEVGGQLVVYNNPVFGVDLSPVLLERITQHEAYVSIKQGTKGLAPMVDVIARVQATGQAQVLAAADLACAAAIGAGAGGVTSTNVWIFPEAFLLLADPGVAPDRKAAVLAALRPYADAVRALGQPRSVKAAMVIRGYAGTAAVRRPYIELSSDEQLRLKSALAAADDALAGLDLVVAP